MPKGFLEKSCRITVCIDTNLDILCRILSMLIGLTLIYDMRVESLEMPFQADIDSMAMFLEGPVTPGSVQKFRVAEDLASLAGPYDYATRIIEHVIVGLAKAFEQYILNVGHRLTSLLED